MKIFNLVYKIKKRNNCEKQSGGSSVKDICFNKIKFLKLLPSCKSVNPLQRSYLNLERTNLKRTHFFPFLAHLSTKCSWWAIVVSGCPSSVVVRRPSCVVRRPSTFDVYTLETTFVTWFWWNFWMFVLTISRLSSNMGHVGSKSRSPGQI